MSELQTLALEHLKKLSADVAHHQEALAQRQAAQAKTLRDLEQRQASTLNALRQLEARQTESEQLLTRLSELYTRLRPLIETIASDLKNEPEGPRKTDPGPRPRPLTKRRPHAHHDDRYKENPRRPQNPQAADQDGQGQTALQQRGHPPPGRPTISRRQTTPLAMMKP